MANSGIFYDVAIIGAGPAGIFTAYKLKQLDKNIKIVIIDAGKSIRNRVCPMRTNSNQPCINCSPCCNIMHGFGGAGSFSDSKLSLTPFGVGGNIVDYIGKEKAVKLIDEVDKIYAEFDEDKDKRKIIGLSENNKDIENIKNLCKKENIEYLECPTKHLGTDGTYKIMSNMEKYLLDNDVTLLFNRQADTIISDENKHYCIQTVSLTPKESDECIFAKYVVIAPGRSGNSWLKSVAKTLSINTKSNKIDIGVRVETSKEIMKYLTDNLYDVKLSYTDPNTGDKIRTFCTNPQGYVSEEHYENDINNLAVVNGHSFSDKKSDNTNFALLVTINDKNLNSNYTRNIVKLSNLVSKNKIIVQNCCDFFGMHETKINNSDNYYTTIPTLNSAVYGDLSLVLPARVYNLIKTFLIKLDKTVAKYIRWNNTWIYGVEAKFYSDLIEVNENFETSLTGIYCIGDGAGITRGITQAASSGLCVAEHIVNRI